MDPTKHQAGVQQELKQTADLLANRKEYSAPRLCRLGSIQAITQGNPGSMSDAATTGDPSGIIV